MAGRWGAAGAAQLTHRDPPCPLQSPRCSRPRRVSGAGRGEVMGGACVLPGPPAGAEHAPLLLPCRLLALPGAAALGRQGRRPPQRPWRGPGGANGWTGRRWRRAAGRRAAMQLRRQHGGGARRRPAPWTASSPSQQQLRGRHRRCRTTRCGCAPGGEVDGVSGGSRQLWPPPPPLLLPVVPPRGSCCLLVALCPPACRASR